jgi:hypothetical protein
MSHTDKDLPYKVREVGKKKKHGRLMRSNKGRCFYGTKCCGFRKEFFSARAMEKHEWMKEVRYV